MAWQHAENLPKVVAPALEEQLRGRLRAFEAWRRVGTWAAATAAAWGVVAAALCLAAIAAGLDIGRAGPEGIVAMWGAGLAATAVALVVFARPWRSGQAAGAVAKAAGLGDDQLLTAGEALDGRAMVTARLGEPLFARALEYLAVRNPLKMAAAPGGLWRLAAQVAVAAAVLLATSMATPEGWALMMAPRPLDGLGAYRQARDAKQSATGGPTLAAFSLHVEAPAYTGREATDLDRPGEVDAATGSKVTLRASFADCTRVEARVGDQKKAAGGGDVEAEAVVRKGGTWEIDASGPGGSTRIGPFALRVVGDARPGVRLVKPDADVDMAEPDAMVVAIEAKDDYGLSRVAVEWRVEGRNGWKAIEVSGAAGKAYSGEVTLDLRPMGLGAGDAIEVRASATDNDAVSGPKTAYSEARRVRIGGAKEEARKPVTAIVEAAAREEDAWQRLQQGVEEMGQQIQQLEQQAQGNGSGAMSAEQKAQMEDLARGIEKSASEIKQAMGDAEARMKMGDLVDQAMMDKVAELHKLAEEILDKDLKAALDRLREMMKESKTADLRGDARKLREMHDKLMRDLERTVELLKRAKVEAVLDALQRRIEELAQRQQDVLDKTKQMKPGDETARREADKQGELARDTEPVAEQMKAASEKAAEVDLDAARRLRDAAQEMAKANPQGQMRKAQQSLQQGEPRSAEPQEQSALQALQRAASQASDARQQAMSRQRREMQAQAAKAAAEALALAQAQAEAMEQTEGLARRGQQAMQQKGQLDRMAGRQEALAQGAERTAQRLRDLSQKSAAAAPELAARMDAAAEAMRDAGRKVQGGEGMAAQMAQRNALGELNQLAADMAALQQAMSRGSAGGDLADLLKQLEQMAEEQRQLNAQAQQAGDGSPMLGQLGDEQAMLREAMERLMQGGGGQLANKLGGVGQDMDDTARDLRQQHLGAETKTRQRDILRKMLDAQQSMYTRERESRDRVAERPKAYKPAATPPALHSSEPPKLKLPKADETATFGVPSEYRDAAAAYERRVGKGAPPP